MNRINVESSSISSVGYDNENEILEIEFTRGAIYQYYNVLYDTYINLIEADSIGRFFSKNISKKYTFKEIK